MKRAIGIAATATSIAALFIGTAASALSPLSNGSFETGTDPGSYATLSAGDTSIDSWKVTSGSIDYIGSYWAASDGSRSLDLSGASAGTIQKTVPTVAGHDYTVTFDFAGNPDGTQGMKALKVWTSKGVSSAKSYTFDTTGKSTTVMGWKTESYTFTAPSTNTVLYFGSETQGSYGPALDNVKISLNKPGSNSDCFKGGWQEYTQPAFTSQADCVKWIHASAIGDLKLADPSQQIRFNVDNRHGGRITYENFDYPGGLKYKTDAIAQNIDVNTKDARFAFQIPAGHLSLSGLYIVVEVKHVANGPDTYGQAVAPDMATAKQWAETGTGFSPTMYTVTKGKVNIN